jgi:phage gp29-like protein
VISFLSKLRNKTLGQPSRAASSRMTDLVAEANRWRDQFNALNGLTVAKVVQLRNAYLRGDMADIQWTYRAIEEADADIFALADRRIAAICRLDWDIKTVSEKSSFYDEAKAEAQRIVLRSAYEAIDNLYEAIEHLAMATFRGYSHLEKHWENGKVVHFEPVDSWNIVRDGFKGAWKLNPDASMSTFSGLSNDLLIPTDNWIIRTVTRHIDWLGVLKFVRAGLCDKDWDAFTERFGLPSSVVIGPPDLKPGKEAEFQAAAVSISEGAPGTLPNGSSIVWPSEVRGQNPFRDRADYLSEKLVLAGTGGKLTMMSAPTGIGQGASGEQADVFADIAAAEAKKISEVFQRQFDKIILEAVFPGQPALAYFELAADEETEPSVVVDQVTKLKGAGYTVSAEEVAEKTGLAVEEAEDSEKDPEEERTPLPNRGVPVDAGADTFSAAIANDLAPLRTRLERLLQIEDPALLKTKLASFRDALPQLLSDILKDTDAEKAMERLLTEAFFDGITKRSTSTSVKNRSVEHQPSELVLNRDAQGRLVSITRQMVVVRDENDRIKVVHEK